MTSNGCCSDVAHPLSLFLSWDDVASSNVELMLLSTTRFTKSSTTDVGDDDVNFGTMLSLLAAPERDCLRDVDLCSDVDDDATSTDVGVHITLGLEANRYDYLYFAALVSWLFSSWSLMICSVGLKDDGIIRPWSLVVWGEKLFGNQFWVLGDSEKRFHTKSQSWFLRAGTPTKDTVVST